MIKNTAIVLLLVTTTFFGYHFFSKEEKQDEIADKVNELVSQKEKRETGSLIKSETAQLVKNGEAHFRPVEELKPNMSEEARQQVSQLENIGLDVKFKDNKDGTMAVQIAHKDRVVKIDQLEKTEQWENREEAILAAVNKNAEKTELSNREREIVEQWKSSH